MYPGIKNDLLDTVKGLVSLVLITTVLVLAASGCHATAEPAHAHKHGTMGAAKASAKTWKPGRRCKVIGKAMTSHVRVRVDRDCTAKNATMVSIVVLNPERKSRIAMEHAAQAVVRILGYAPNLQAVVYSKWKGRPFLLAVVTGSSTATVALRK